MMRQVLIAVSLVVIGGTPILFNAERAAGFNDKMLILHNGTELCVDWWAWPGHMIQHQDTLLGECDVPED